MDSAPALGLPEVMLGLVPGWGGAYLVPNLIGADKAVTVILENPLNNGKTLGGRAAYEIGLADACFSGADYLEQSLLWAVSVLTGEIVVERPRGRQGRGVGRRRRARSGACRRPRPVARARRPRRPSS